MKKTAKEYIEIKPNKRVENNERPTIPSIFMAKSMKDKIENDKEDK